MTAVYPELEIWRFVKVKVVLVSSFPQNNRKFPFPEKLPPIFLAKERETKPICFTEVNVLIVLLNYSKISLFASAFINWGFLKLLNVLSNKCNK